MVWTYFLPGSGRPLPGYWLQVFEDGYHLPTRMRSFPNLLHSSSRICVNFPQPTSETDFPSFRLFFIAAMSRSSIAIRSYFRTSLTAIWCRKSSLRCLAFACRRTIRKQHSRIQPHDIVRFVGRKFETSGCHNNGTRAILLPEKKSVAVKKLDIYRYAGGYYRSAFN